MVQVVYNRTEVEGTIVSRSSHPSLKDFDLLTVDVARTAPVPGVADLVSANAESRIEIAVKRELLPDGPLEGKRIRCRAYLGGPGAFFAEPTPEPGSFEIID